MAKKRSGRGREERENYKAKDELVGGVEHGGKKADYWLVDTEVGGGGTKVKRKIGKGGGQKKEKKSLGAVCRVNGKVVGETNNKHFARGRVQGAFYGGL